ncbi:MAG: hypothetical protein LAO19_02215 [Acidobacteriia bacterium]|nr:hypothetical protein [Terriglobia bacterium]
MGSLINFLDYLLGFCGAMSAFLVVLVIYGNALDSREDEELYLNQKEQNVMAGDQPALIARMNRLARVIAIVAVVTGVSLLGTAGLWVWIRLYKS